MFHVVVVDSKRKCRKEEKVGMDTSQFYAKEWR